jgi:hypothetical protein
MHRNAEPLASIEEALDKHGRLNDRHEFLLVDRGLLAGYWTIRRAATVGAWRRLDRRWPESHTLVDGAMADDEPAGGRMRVTYVEATTRARD